MYRCINSINQRMMGSMLTVMTYYPKLTFTQHPPLPKYSLQQKPHCCGSIPTCTDAQQMLPDWEARQKWVPQLLGTRHGSICCYWSQQNSTEFPDSRHWKRLILCKHRPRMPAKQLYEKWPHLSIASQAREVHPPPYLSNKKSPLCQGHTEGRVCWAHLTGWDAQITPKRLNFCSKMVFESLVHLSVYYHHKHLEILNKISTATQTLEMVYSLIPI